MRVSREIQLEVEDQVWWDISEYPQLGLAIWETFTHHETDEWLHEQL